MDMETVSSQLLSRYFPDRSQESSTGLPRKDKRIDEQHPGHRADHVHRHESGRGIEQRRDIEDNPDKHKHRHEDAGETGALTYRRSERTSLMVETLEGDTVRLKVKASESLTVNGGQLNEDGDTIADIEMLARSHTRISVKVKGDLNEQEMTAIQAIIDQAGSMATDFFAGDAEDAFATASALEIDATQLANVRIRMKSSEQLTYPMGAILPAQVREPEETASEPVAVDMVADKPDATAVAAPGGQEPVEETAGASDVTADGELAGSTAATADGTTAVEENTTPDRNQVIANALQSIGEFLNNLLSAFGGSDDVAGNSVSSSDMTLKLQVFRAMLMSVSEMKEPVSEEPATALAADTIDALTVQQSPLDAVA